MSRGRVGITLLRGLLVFGIAASGCGRALDPLAEHPDAADEGRSAPGIDAAEGSIGRSGADASYLDAPSRAEDGGGRLLACGVREGAPCGAGCGTQSCISDWPICDTRSACPLFTELPAAPWPMGQAADEWGSGLALADVDGNGLIDAFAGAPDGVWVVWDVVAASGAVEPLLTEGGPMHVAAVTAVDADGDGDLDLFVTTQHPSSGVHLLINDGARRFVDRSSMLHASRVERPGGPAWADFDGDEDLDVFVPCYLGAASLLFRNDGTRFVDVALEAGVAEPAAASLQGHWLDYDADGDPDLFVANDKGVATGIPSRLFRNDDGRFVDVTDELGLSRLAHGMGVASGDIDGDLDLDLYVSDIGYLDGGQMLFTAHEERFREVAHEWYAAAPRWYGWGTEMMDFDVDGDLDLFLAGTMPWQVWIGENVGGRVVEMGDIVEELPDQGQVGMASADFDLDGRLDLAFWIMIAGDRIAPGPIVRFFLNRAPRRGHFLRLALRNRAPNTYGVGATVHVHAGGRTWMRVLSAGTSFFSSSEPVLHFGLGGAATIDRVEVTWPDGGATVITGPIESDRLLTVER